MGLDIHLNIVKNGMVLEKEIFDGRNSEWFHNLMREGCYDDDYETLPCKWGTSDQAPEELIEEYEGWTFDPYYMSVKDFKNWFTKYKPNRQAGWVSTYDKWRMENKGYIPVDAPHYLNDDMRIEDYHFVEWENPYDCSLWLYKYLVVKQIDNDADIMYCFDN